MSKRALIGVLVVIVFVGYLLWSTLASQGQTCRVCVAFRGRQNCATTSAATLADAKSNAQTTACGPIASGMNDAITCENELPTAAECKTR